MKMKVKKTIKSQGLKNSKPKKIYFIGITGTAISGLAILAKAQGYEVNGSDVDEVFVTNKVLKQNGITFFLGFDARHIVDWQPDLVVIGASWGKENVEVAEVLKEKIPTRTHSEFMHDLGIGKKTIAVCGTHGKTTTTSLAAYLMRAAELDPSFLIGAGASPELGTNAHEGTSKYFVVEADEYKKSRTENVPKFMDLDPEYVLLTSIELDHTDFFKSIESMKSSFRKFLQKKSIKKVFTLSDDKNIQDVTKGLKNIVRVGRSPESDYSIEDVQELVSDTKFTLRKGTRTSDFSLLLPGIFSVTNTSLVLALLDEIGVPFAQITKELAQFRGALRRFQITKQGSLTVVDDYAHHPTACKLTLEAARKRFPNKRIICVFQPHQVTRTKYFKNEFAKAFGACDEVIFADIFASARENAKGYTSQDLAKLASKYQKNVSAGGSLKAIGAKLSRRKLGANNVLITMGAGDVYKLVDYIK